MNANQPTAASGLGRGNDVGHDSTAGLTVVALLLALLLGFAAADINRQPPAAGSGNSLEAGQTVLDGRGKWGGYL